MTSHCRAYCKVMGSKIVMGATGLMPVFQYILYESRRNGLVYDAVITDRCKVMDNKGILGTYTMLKRGCSALSAKNRQRKVKTRGVYPTTWAATNKRVVEFTPQRGRPQSVGALPCPLKIGK